MAHDRFSSSDSNASGNPKSLRERMSQDLQLRGMAQRTHDGSANQIIHSTASVKHIVSRLPPESVLAVATM